MEVDENESVSYIVSVEDIDMVQNQKVVFHLDDNSSQIGDTPQAPDGQINEELVQIQESADDHQFKDAHADEPDNSCILFNNSCGFCSQDISGNEDEEFALGLHCAHKKCLVKAIKDRWAQDGFLNCPTCKRPFTDDELKKHVSEDEWHAMEQ